MNRDKLKKLIRGIIVATPTPFNNALEVDYGKMAEMTKWWVSKGLVESKAVIKCASLMGEGPQLTHDEWPLLLKSVIKAAEGKVPVIGCIHSTDTKKSIRDALIAQDLGATGLQVSAALFNDPNQDDILRYFESLSNAIEIGIMVYQTPWNKYGEIMPETFKEMANFEHVIAIKWCQANSFEYKEMKDLAPHFNILENGSNISECYQLGGQGFLDEQATAYPEFDLKILNLMEANKFKEGQALWDSAQPIRDFYQKLVIRSGGQARLKKAVMEAMNISMGSMRPPSLPHSNEEIQELRRILLSIGWPISR